MKKYRLFSILLLSVIANLYSQVSNDSDYILKLEFKAPIKQNISEFLEIVPTTLYHSPSKGYFYVLVSEQELDSIFGLTLTHRTVRGAGNCVNRDAYFTEITDIKNLNERIKTHLKDLYIEDDPKFPVIDDAVEYLLNPGK